MSGGADPTSSSLRALVARHVSSGRVTAIVLRPGRDIAAVCVDEAHAIVGRGLDGDRRGLGPPKTSTKRELSIIQHEHVPLIARWTGHEAIDPAVLRRNLVIEGLNVLAMKSPFADLSFLWRIGDEVVIRVTGPCDPCSKMEAALGPGAYNAMRGHGGVTACLVEGGRIRVGDAVTLVEP